MIKKLLLSLVVAVISVFVAAFFYIDSIVKTGIEAVGSDVLGRVSQFLQCQSRRSAARELFVA
jgi:hypothetical protein